LLRYLDNEAGAARVADIIKAHLAGKCEAIISAPHWGEVAGITCKLHGRQAMELVLSRLSAFGFQVVAADADRAVGRSADQAEEGRSLRRRFWRGAWRLSAFSLRLILTSSRQAAM